MMVDKITKTDSSNNHTTEQVTDTVEITVPAEVTYTITIATTGTITIA